MHVKTPLLGALALLPSTLSTIIKNPQKPLSPVQKPPSPISHIPLLGFGTWNLKPDEHNASAAVSAAIAAGYRHIDCAAAYRNEKDVGRGIKEGLEKAGLRREDLWVTSKLWNDMHDPLQVERALDKTLLDLGLPYLDLYLMHWPVSKLASGENIISFIPTWNAMTKLPLTGKVRHVGISNFSPSQLKVLLDDPTTDTTPFAHQMELHPYLPQTAWLQYHAAHGIHVTAYSPLGNANPGYAKDPPALLENDAIVNIAEKRGCSPAQVVLAWGVSRGTSVIPKSKHVERIEENFGALGCGLEYVDFVQLEGVGRKPVRFNNPSEGWGLHLYDGLQDSS